MTGETYSVLGATGFVIIGIVSYLKIRNKK
ncbi:TPA: hypothetical protein TZW69_001554 [Streptococcus suis]|uniref:Uncharacterized protein n=2 Tax=Streptococcus suis TaxID=1307 RepID=A0A116KX19_STRSU|nr:hypothetical protein [Streptococcus suis]NQH55945.1 hypothetical protein [Streptococcus suis]NQL70035.1 hypothetical protein [Streptococcus suis]NQN63862.1 hypothetical protein [Streptococcus suis]NQO52519.1 hypothetical protein [Streptococcus suis]